MSDFYSGEKILSMLDSEGDKPEIFISIGNRSGGKTTYYNKWFFKRWLNNKEKFILMFRYTNELDMCWNNFTSKILEFFPGHTFESKINSMGVCELFCDNINCGWGISLNNCDKIKRISHLLSEAKRMLFDDFLPETGRYLKNEIELFISIHTSIAREFGNPAKYLPVFLISNNVSIVNPYFSNLGISKLVDGREYYKGIGWVMEKRTIELSKNAVIENKFNQAFSSNRYVSYMTDNESLLDNYTNVIKRPKIKREVAIILHGDKKYSIKEFDSGIYIDTNTLNQTCNKYTDDYFSVNTEYKYIKTSLTFLSVIKNFIDNGRIYYATMQIKSDFIDIIS